MRKYFKQVFAGSLLLVSAVLTSCSSDYLDTDPTESVSDVAAVSSAANAYKSLNGIARTMSCQQYAWSQGVCGENRIITIYENYMSQDFIYNRFAPGWADVMNIEYTVPDNTSYAVYPWYYYYNIIGQANTIINRIDAASGEEAEKAFCKGSALTFRAYAYQKLVNYYCKRWKDSNNGTTDGVVLRLDESIGSQAPATLIEVYNQIYKDCDDALANFATAKAGGYDRHNGDIWIPNENVAHAVYARAAITRDDYATALTHAKLAQENFPLMSPTDYQSGFCKPTSEWIMGSFGDATENNWYWTFGTQFAANSYYCDASNYGAGAISKDLTDQIPDEDVRKQLFLTVDKMPGFDITDPDNVNQTWAWIEGDDMWDAANAYISAHHAKYTAAYSEPYKTGYYYIGSHLKFYIFDTPGVSYLPFIRTSEMVLLEAEANYFLNKEADAQAALVKLNAGSGRNPNYTCTKTGNDLFEEIVNYRGLELWGEGFGFSDFKRWKRPIVRHSLAQGSNAHVTIAVTVPVTSGNDWTWSVPQREKDYNDAYKDSADPAAE